MALRALAITLLAAAVPSLAYAGHCRQFFYQPVAVQQVVYPAVAVSPYLYQAGRDIEADALAAKVARLVVPQIVQQLQAPQQQRQAVTNSVMAQRCAKCHSGANPKAGLILDGSSPVNCHQITAAIRAVRDDLMPRGGPALTPEQKGSLLEELLSLEADRPVRPQLPEAPPPAPMPGELK